MWYYIEENEHISLDAKMHLFFSISRYEFLKLFKGADRTFDNILPLAFQEFHAAWN